MGAQRERSQLSFRCFFLFFIQNLSFYGVYVLFLICVNTSLTFFIRPFLLCFDLLFHS